MLLRLRPVAWILPRSETEADGARGTRMTNYPTDWHQTLAGISGELVRGEERITTHDLLTQHLGVPVSDRAARRLRRVMRELGWRGPRRMRWGTRFLNGYWRHPTVGPPEIVREQPAAVVTAERGVLASRLEAVAGQGLEKVSHILALPTDPSNGNVLRAQTAAANIAIGAQIRVDENRLRERRNDVLPELLRRIGEEEARLLEATAREERKLEQKRVDPALASDNTYSPKPSQN